MKIQKFKNIYPATIAAAIKDANFVKDGKAMTQSDLNKMFKDAKDEEVRRVTGVESVILGVEPVLEIEMGDVYKDTAMIELVASANEAVLGNVEWTCDVESAEITDGMLVFREHYEGEVRLTASALNATAEKVISVSCDEVSNGVSYEVSNVLADVAECDAVSAVVSFTGSTIYHYPMKPDERVDRVYEQTVEFDVNENEDEVVRTGSFTWNGVEVEWSVRQKGVKVDSLPGDVLCSDFSIVRPVIGSDGVTVESVNLGGKTPIAVCVVPSSHMEDGKGRWMSLDFMRYDTPDSGSQSAQAIYWGGYQVDISTLPNKTSVPLKSGGTNSYGYLGSKTQFNASYFTELESDGLYYYNTSNKIHAPFNADGTPNSDYRKSNTATADFDGKGNTDKIIAEVTVDWTSGSISNSYSSGNYPAACCCRRYSTTGTQPGDWYLPSCGELGYFMYNAQMINNVLSKIGKVTIPNSSSYLWSSTEYSSNYTMLLRLYNGYVGSYNKNNYYHVRSFLAF